MRRLIISLALMFLLVSSVTVTNFASAYEKENHYWLKMALALNCGFTIDEARVIATGDWNMDEDSETAPVRTGSGTDNPKWKWHALPTEDPDVDKNQPSAGNQQIKQRQHDLYNRALNEKDTGMRLFKFGQYLHYEEDKWSHWGYTTGIGHALPNVAPGMTSPDQTHANPETYRYMVFDSMVNLGKLAKSLGKDTQCVSDLVPLDTYHGSPEYGKDFPWVSPQEIKRSDADKFKKSVDKHLSDWGKTALINEVIDVSKKKGEEGVTESFISYISGKTGISKSDVGKKYDYIYVDIDDNGDAKKLPDVLIKFLKSNDKKTSSVKNKTKSNVDLAHFQKLYKISKMTERLTSALVTLNDGETKELKKTLDLAKKDYTKTKKPETQKLVQKIQNQIKDAESDKKDLTKLVDTSKTVTKKITEFAAENGVKKNDLAKIAIPNKPLDHSAIGSALLDITTDTDKLASVLFGTTTEADRKEARQYVQQLANFNKEHEKTTPPQTSDAPLESILDEIDDFGGPDARPPQNKDSKQSQVNPDAPPESILDDIPISGPDVNAPKPKPQLEIKSGPKQEIKLENDKSSCGTIRGLWIYEASCHLQDERNDYNTLIDIRDFGIKSTTDQPRIDRILIGGEPQTNTSTKPKTAIGSGTQEKPGEKGVIGTGNAVITNTKPVMTIPSKLTLEATGPSGAEVRYDATAQDKEDGFILPKCTPEYGSIFPIGTTTVTCTTKDSGGNSVSGTFTVTIRDTTPPAFGPFQPTEGVKDDTGVQVFFDVTATDLVDGSVPVSCNYQSGYKFPPGVTDLKCTASDSRGNQSTKTVQITVKVTES
ncbi:MAG: HYR domain-containing protein [Nitrososphaeria archaeon]|nr:HYR domain-containing protein [Nitrososphaeria archaeon]